MKLFTLNFILIFILTSSEVYNFKQISLRNEIKNILSVIIQISGLFISMIIYFIFYHSEEYICKNLEIFKDWRFYFTLSTEIFGFWLIRKNYYVNSNNLTAINFSLFLSLIIVPIYSFFGNDFFGFQNTHKINYHSSFEFYIFITVILLLSILFFMDKLKGKINNLKILVLLPMIMSNNLYFTSKLMQIYNSFFIYSMIAIVMIAIFTIMSIKNDEFSKIRSEDKYSIIKIMLITFVSIPINNITITLIASEFFTLIKRINQILSGLLFDKIFGNKDIFNFKDVLIIILLISSGFLLYAYRS